MFSEWSAGDWIILIVDIIALYIIVRFLSWKVKHKLEEVEQRQKFETRQRKLDRTNLPLAAEDE
ncbi:MAG: hypothetical protein CBC59_003600 [Euryarchaeota archaeon TMED99]|jgi:uncharacterized membrane-anchored protein YhcB (DUF1043 family)|nr:MAG: hypothetical protein CBC59_003600 [Euryarchaeota archaeon TMED99]|tara:strand:- start:2835 stop:3026 length:192 start_codon:yes stop_codon:yes gene_type:complete